MKWSNLPISVSISNQKYQPIEPTLKFAWNKCTTASVKFITIY